MTAKQFKAIWQQYTARLRENPEWIRLWHNDSMWTNEVQQKFPPLEKWHWSNNLKSELVNELKADTIILAPEYRKIDFVAALPTNAEVQTMGEDDLTINEASPESLHYGFLEVAIEFENSIASSFQEMVKLTQIRAKLKVLVTYDYDHQGKPEPYWVDTAVQNWKGIIEEAQARLPEPGVEYLFIIGQLSNTDSDPVLSWSYFDETAELLN